MKTYNPPPTKIGAYGEALKGYEIEVDERKAILLENNPDMNWVHALNKAKKEIIERGKTTAPELLGESK